MQSIEQAEAEEGGARYEWVVRARPDMYWYDDHEQLCGTTHRILQHKFPEEQWWAAAAPHAVLPPRPPMCMSMWHVARGMCSMCILPR